MGEESYFGEEWYYQVSMLQACDALPPSSYSQTIKTLLINFVNIENGKRRKTEKEIEIEKEAIAKRRS